jgi:hypothetical protein
MGIRESIERHKPLVVAATILVVLIAGIFAWRQMAPATPNAGSTSDQAFYSVDDGAHLFTASAELVPPIDHEGKQACRAYVFSCDGGKTQFVAYLERYTPQAKKAMEAARDALKRGDKDARPPPMQGLGNIEVKKPGAKDWVNRASGTGVEITRVTCPDGKGTPEAVVP